MSIFDIFNNDAFSVITMSRGLSEARYVPSRIGQLGLFEPESIDTLDFAIEKEIDGTLILVASSARGGPGQVIGGTERNLRKLSVPHFQRDDAITADEVQGVRMFGTEQQVMSMTNKIAAKARRHMTHFALTDEYHRLNIIKTGNLLDANGSVMVNFATEFGETKPAEIDFDLDNASPVDGILRERCAGIYEAMAEALDGLPFTGIRAMCGKAFFKDLIKHKEVRDTYKGYAEAATLRSGFVQANAQSGQSGILSSFEFGDITWEWYRGGSNVGIDDNKCHFVPEGVPGLFRSVYAPADYIETVNTMGLPMYAKQWTDPNGKRVNLEFQRNVLHFCTRPRLLMQARRT